MHKSSECVGESEKCRCNFIDLFNGLFFEKKVVFGDVRVILLLLHVSPDSLVRLLSHQTSTTTQNSFSLFFFFLLDQERDLDRFQEQFHRSTANLRPGFRVSRTCRARIACVYLNCSNIINFDTLRK